MKNIQRLIRRFNTQLEALPPEGYILQGSVIKHCLRRTREGETKTYGPYYIWTRKVNSKTVTRALTADQAKVIKDAIRRNKSLEQRLAALRTLSEQIITAITPCVARRKKARPRS